MTLARFDAARGRGRAQGHRRGASPGDGVAPGPARPDAPERLLSEASLSQPGPGLAARTWPRIRVEDLRAFYREHYRPDGAVLVLAGDVEPDAGHGADRGALRRHPPGAPAPRRPDVRRAAPDRPARLHADRVRVAAAGAPRLAHGAAGSSRQPGARRPGRPAQRGPPIAALAGPGRAGAAGHLGRGRARAGAAGPGSSSSRSSARPGPSRPSSSGGSRRSSASSPSTGRPTEELARARSRLEAGWRWEQEDLAGPGRGHRPCRALGRLARLAGRAPRRPWPSTPPPSAAWPRAYLTRGNLTVGWSLPRLARSVTRIGRHPGRQAKAVPDPDRGECRRCEPDGPRAGRSRIRTKSPAAAATPGAAADRHPRGGHPGPSTSGLAAPAWRTACASFTSDGTGRASSPWSCMSMPAGSARRGRGSPT